MKPIYEVSIAGEIIDFGGRLVSLQISQDRDRFDPIGSDCLEIVLEDTKSPRLQIPPRGRALRVKLGYEGQPLVDKGIYIVDETEISGPPNTLTIRAQNNPKTAHSDSYNPMTTRITRSWQTPLTVQDLVAKVAIDHGLSPQISPSLASIALPHIDQVNMTDLELLSQYVGKVYDAFVLVQDSWLIVLKNGEGQTVNDADVPNIFVFAKQDGETIDPSKVYITSWRTRFTDFVRYDTVKAYWFDLATAEQKEEMAGSGQDPTMRLPYLYPDAATAKAAAQTIFNRCNTGVGEISCDFPGVPQLFSGGRLYVSGLHPDVDQSVWYCRRVVHMLAGDGLWTEVRGDRITSDMIAEMEAK